MNYRRKRLLLQKKKLLILQHAVSARKRLWVHPLNLQREKKGLYANLVPDLRDDNAVDRHHHYFRMSRECYGHLLQLVTPQLTKQDTTMREAIKPDLKLAVTIHHLAEGASHGSIATHYRLGKSTVSEIIYDTCQAIIDVLEPVYLKPPSGPEQWKLIAQKYENNYYIFCFI